MIDIYGYPLAGLEVSRNLTERLENCATLKKTEDCKEVLIQLEALQIKELAKENYSCQTRLLGLQSDVIMILKELSNTISYKENFNEVREFCDDF